jgi:hypothetical protein
MRLWIQIHGQRLMPITQQRSNQIEYRRGLPHAALLVKDRNFRHASTPSNQSLLHSAPLFYRREELSQAGITRQKFGLFSMVKRAAMYSAIVL